MALGDKQILSTRVEDGSSDYLIPGAVSLQLKAVQALFTDNGAAGDWLPAVVAISDSGDVFWRAVDQAVKVTAGSDAEVSWFPGVKHAQTATAAGVLDWAWGVRSAGMFGDPAFSCPDNVATAHPFPNTFGSPHGAFTWLSGGNPNDILQFNKTGLYLVAGASQWSGSGAFVRALLTNPNTTLTLHGDTTSNTIIDTNPGALGTTWTFDLSMFLIGAVPTDTELQLFQQSGGAINVTNASLGAFYFGDT